ncbi:hypothetical protein GFS31_17830 [Leptolyngbya sp. BL0902]|nr:hypothetical protein GFS31_17830 [Leptolyngbya sp. BL0902]
MIVLTWAVVGCAKPTEPTALLAEPTEAPHLLAGPIAEVSPPETLDTLKQIIDAYTPQVRILSPRPGEVVENATVSVRFQVRGLPLFKDKTWQLGPHLHVFLDDQPYQAVYDASEALILEDLAPGTHTLRVFASRPWHESFKNEGAFDQRTFHIFAPTPQNEVNASAPLLTYSRPQGTYGAEPIMLDFYLTNAPLHLSAQADSKDDIHDWRIRCTVNGQSFVFDQWQPIYLKGFQPGQNWVQLELIDETGRPIDNRFNNTVRIIDYQPGGTDTLSRLVRGELDFKAVASIIDPTYTPPAPEPIDEAMNEADAPASTVPPTSPAPTIAAPASKTKAQDQPTPAPTDPSDSALDAADPDESALNAPEISEPGLGSEDRDKTDLEATDLKTTDIETTDLETSSPDEANLKASEAEVKTEESPIFAPAPEVEDRGGNVNASQPTPKADPQPDTEIPPNSEPVPALDPFASEDSQGQTSPTQTQTQASPSQMTMPPASPMERGKGMMKRWKNWAQQQTLPGFGDDQPAVTPDPPPIPVYEVPATTDMSPAPAEEADPSEADPNGADEQRMVMPELIEPYLTQPYMTEPRLDFQPLEPEDMGESSPSDRGEAPADSEPADRPQPDLRKRPYI